jgi:hypothetical protein
MKRDEQTPTDSTATERFSDHFGFGPRNPRPKVQPPEEEPASEEADLPVPPRS